MPQVHTDEGILDSTFQNTLYEESQLSHQVELCRQKYPSIVLKDDKIELLLMEVSVHVVIPKNSSSELIMQALDSLGNVLQRFHLSVVFGPITFQQIFSASHLQNESTSRSELSDYEARLLGNLGFSILYKLHQESPEKFMREYGKIRRCMSESGRQSVLEHFANVYPEWPSSKQEIFVKYFDYTFYDIKTIEVARWYYAVIGEKAKEFLGFAMLQMLFNEEEMRPFTTDDDKVFSLPGLSIGFIKFPEASKNDDERIFAWRINQMLIAALPLNPLQREITDIVNVIELGDTEAIRGINVEVMCKLFKIYKLYSYKLIGWINLIWSKLGVADSQRLLASSSILFSEIPFPARLALAPNSVFQTGFDRLDVELLDEFLYALCNFPSSEMKTLFKQALRCFIKGDLYHDYCHHKVVMAALHFYSVEEDHEMIKLLTAYFSYDLPDTGNLIMNLPVDSPVWAEDLVIAYVNSEPEVQDERPEYVDWAISSALVRKDDEFIRQLNVPNSKIIKIAYECGAIPLCYSIKQLETVLGNNISDESSVVL